MFLFNQEKPTLPFECVTQMINIVDFAKQHRTTKLFWFHVNFFTIALQLGVDEPLKA